MIEDLIKLHLGFHPSMSALILRLILGIIIIAHGYPKLFKKDYSAEGLSGLLKQQGVPTATFVAYSVGIVELFGGILLCVGLLTRICALAIAVDRLVILTKFKLNTGLKQKVMDGRWVGGYERDLALAAIALVLVALGTGKFSIDYQVFHAW